MAVPPPAAERPAPPPVPVDDPYGLDDGEPEERTTASAPVLARSTGGRSQKGKAKASAGVPPWAWVAGAVGAVVVVGLTSAWMLTRGPSTPAPKPGGPKVAAPAGGFVRDNTASGPAPVLAPAATAWRVEADPAATPVVFPPGVNIDIPVPYTNGNDSILYPTAPSRFVLLGGNEDDQKHREVWDLSTGKEVGRLKGHIDIFTPRAFSPDGAYFVAHTLFEPKNFDIWRTADSTRIGRIADDGKHLYEIVDFVGPGPGRLVIGSGLSKFFQVWDFLEGKPLAKIAIPDKFYPESFTTSPGGRYLAFGVYYKNWIQIYDMKDGSLAGEYKIDAQNDEHAVRGLSFSPDGKALAAILQTLNTSHLMVWDMADGKVAAHFKREGRDAYGTFHGNLGARSSGSPTSRAG